MITDAGNVPDLAWGNYSGSGVLSLGNAMRFSLVSVSATGGDASYGNFVDAAAFGVGVGAKPDQGSVIPEPATLPLSATALAAAVALTRRHRKARGL